MHRFVLTAAAAALAAAPLPAVAQQSPAQENLIHEVRGGLLLHGVEVWGTARDDDGAAVNGEIAFGSNRMLLDGRIRPVVGASIAGGERISYGYADLRWEYSAQSVPLFFGIGIGAAIHDGERDGRAGETDLGSRVLFHIPLEVGYQFTPANRISLYFEHVSNAWLADPNPGMDNIGVRLAHRF